MPGFFYFRIMEGADKKLIDSLDDEQKAELFLAYEESLNEDNLLSHEEVKAQHKKWLQLQSK